MSEEKVKDGVVGWMLYGKGAVEGGAADGEYYWPVPDDGEYKNQIFLSLGAAEERYEEVLLDKDSEFSEDELVIFAVRAEDGVILIPTHLVNRPVVPKEEKK